MNNKIKKDTFLIVGLGNPGKEYEDTKHNTGYIAIDCVAKKLGLDIEKSKFNGLYCKTKINDSDVFFVKPTTYMNLSGNCVVQFANYYNIPVENIVIIYDDVDIDMGYMRIRERGSAGTHNGMRSIVSSLDSEDFPRIRIGIKSLHDEPLIDYVLSRYTAKQKEELLKLSDHVYDAVLDIVNHNIAHAMNVNNVKEK